MSIFYLIFSLIWSFVIVAGITHSAFASLIAFAVMMLWSLVTHNRGRRKILSLQAELPHLAIIREIRNNAELLKDEKAKKLLRSICNKAKNVIDQGNFDEANYLLDLQNLAIGTANLRSMRKQEQSTTFAENEAKLLQFKQKLNNDLGKRDRALKTEAQTRFDFLSSTISTDEFPAIESTPQKPSENFSDTVNLLKRASESQKD